jgi:hypothetical protein
MKIQARLCLYRLFAGIACNILLWLLPGGFGMSNEAFRPIFLAASVAVAGFVFVLPVFWRGAPWQVPIAFVLLWFPGMVLFEVVLVCQQ